MAEISRFWDGTTLGDAIVAPYDASVEFANVLKSLSGAGSFDLTGASGVFTHEPLVDSELLTDSGGVSPAIVLEGRALVDGTWYENDAAVYIVIPTPGVATRIDRIVLRKDFALQTVRLTRIAGAEGGTAPAVTQVAGVTWDMYLSSVSITTGGVITIADEREFLNEGAIPMAFATGTAVDIGTGGAPSKLPLNLAVASYMITHDTVNSRFTALYPGMYLCGYSIPGGIGYVNPAGLFARGNISFAVRKNGAAYYYGGINSIPVHSYGGVVPSNNDYNLSQGVSATALVNLASGDYVEIWKDTTQLYMPAGAPSIVSVPTNAWIIRVSRMKVPR